MERRELFKIIGATAVSAELGFGQHAHGAGSKLSYAPRYFTPEQLQMLNQLCEIIIPSDEESPGAGKANVAIYLDMFVNFRGKGTQQIFIDGLAAADSIARSKFSKPFSDLSPADQDAVVATLASNELDRNNASGRFFELLKTQTVLGYHYSELGSKQYMGYKGNTGVPEFPGCTHDGHHQI